MISNSILRFILFTTWGVFVLAAIALILTNSPWWDEGLLAGPAYTFMHHGYLGSTVFVSMSHFQPLQGIEQHLYVWMPLYPIVLGAWMRVVSYSLVSMRLLSLVFGLLTLAAWYAILWKLTARTAAALLGVVLIATDYYYIIQSATARYETMTCALGFGACAVYLLWRESHFTRAVAVSSLLAAAAVFTHPLGLLHTAALGVLLLRFDWRRLTPKVIAIGIAPFLIFAAAWGAYILQAPADFHVQYENHTAHRTVALASPLHAVVTDLYWRYLFAFYKNLTSRWMFPVRTFTALIYITGLLGTLLLPGLRKQTAARLLFLFCLVDYVGLALLDTQKSAQYLVHIFPPLLALSAVAIEYLYRAHRRSRIPLAAFVAVVILSGLGAVAVKARKNSWAYGYTPAASFVKAHLAPDDVVIGPAQLTFALGPQAHLRDDPHLGYGFPWGANPKLIVVTSFWDLDFIRSQNNPVANWVTTRLREYRPVYDGQGYTVYARPGSL